MRAKDDHLIPIGGDIIALHLERTGFLNMASWVRHIDQEVAAANKRAHGYLQHANQLAARLEQYERKDKPHDPRPPAEASD